MSDLWFSKCVKGPPSSNCSMQISWTPRRLFLCPLKNVEIFSFFLKTDILSRLGSILVYVCTVLHSSLLVFPPLPSFHFVSCQLCCSLLQRFSGCGSGRRADVSRGRRARVHRRVCARPAHRRQRARRSKYCTVHSTPLHSTLLFFLSSYLFHSAFVWLLKLCHFGYFRYITSTCES